MRNNIVIDDFEISIAQRGVTTRCAIAAAIMTQIPAARHIKVDENTISWLDVDRRERFVFRTPESAKVFIRNWDQGNSVSPFGFTLTDTALIDRRPPKAQSTRTRVTRSQQKPVRSPGSRMTRATHCPEGESA